LLTVTASTGISHSRGRSPLVVLRETEQALASAKAGGRNCERQFSTPEPKTTAELRLVPAQTTQL
jgi:PleD family two-component response regulator